MGQRPGEFDVTASNPIRCEALCLKIDPKSDQKEDAILNATLNAILNANWRCWGGPGALKINENRSWKGTLGGLGGILAPKS